MSLESQEKRKVGLKKAFERINVGKVSKFGKRHKPIYLRSQVEPKQRKPKEIYDKTNFWKLKAKKKAWKQQDRNTTLPIGER